jgi:hypothetical protein
VVDLGEFFAQNNTAIFVSMFFITILPTGLLFSVCGLVLRFHIDKHGLLRRWARMPEIGSTMLKTCIVHMEICVVVAMVMANRFLGGWPFDNACVVYDEDTGQETGDFALCKREAYGSLFYTSRPYMDYDQNLVTDLCSWLAIVCITVEVSTYFVFTSMFSLRSLCFGIYHPVGEPSTSNFTTVDEIQAYVPQVRCRHILYLIHRTPYTIPHTLIRHTPYTLLTHTLLPSGEVHGTRDSASGV